MRVLMDNYKGVHTIVARVVQVREKRDIFLKTCFSIFF